MSAGNELTLAAIRAGTPFLLMSWGAESQARTRPLTGDRRSLGITETLIGAGLLPILYSEPLWNSNGSTQIIPRTHQHRSPNTVLSIKRRPPSAILLHRIHRPLKAIQPHRLTRTSRLNAGG